MSEPQPYCAKCEDSKEDHEPLAGEWCSTCEHWCRFVPMSALRAAARQARGEKSPPKGPLGYA